MKYHFKSIDTWLEGNINYEQFQDFVKVTVRNIHGLMTGRIGFQKSTPFLQTQRLMKILMMRI